MYRVKWHGRSDIFTHYDRAFEWAERHPGTVIYEVNPYGEQDTQVWPAPTAKGKPIPEQRKEQILKAFEIKSEVTIKELIELTGLTPGQIQKPLENLCRTRKLVRHKIVVGTAHMHVYKKYSNKLVDILK